MIKQNGVIYRELEDILNMLYKTKATEKLMGKYIYVKDLIKDEELWWKFETLRDIGFFIHDCRLEAVPTDIVTEKLYSVYLEGMTENPILETKRDYFEDIIEGIESFIDEQIYLYSNKTKKIIEQPCYIWLYSPNLLQGVYSGIPMELLDGPLSKNITYDCCLCGAYEITQFEIPDFYYDKETSNYYCPKCASGKNLQHLGE